MIYVLHQWSEGQLAGVVQHLERHGLPFDIIEAFAVKRWPEPRLGDAVIALGGPPSVCNLRARDYQHRFLLEEERFIATARRRSVLVLGICLSHQLLACMEDQPVVCGARSFGLQPVTLTAAGRSHWLFHSMPAELTFLQAHQDYVTSIPRGAQLLATSPGGVIEAVAWDETTVSTQFHPEALEAQLAASLKRCPAWLAASGCTLDEMLARVPARYTAYTERLFDNFLGRVAKADGPRVRETLAA